MLSSSQDKLALFRQQASVISNKKAAIAEKLQTTMVELEDLKKQHSVKVASKGAQSRIPQGDEFKQYIATLRTKSSLYKSKKAELQFAVSENAILQRTVEILQVKQADVDRALKALEQRHGVSGSNATRAALEQMSEKKSAIDAAKADTVESVSQLVEQLLGVIADKRSKLAPSIEKLKSQRAALSQEMQVHTEQSRIFDSAVVGIETELAQLNVDAVNLKSDIAKDLSRWHFTAQTSSIVDAQMDRVLEEMKAYIGGSSSMNGFKTCRDILQRKVAESEQNLRGLREKQQMATSSHPEKLKQKQLLSTLLQALDARNRINRNTLDKRAKSPTAKEVLVRGSNRLYSYLFRIDIVQLMKPLVTYYCSPPRSSDS
jgi:intraflagellar transport protein 81